MMIFTFKSRNRLRKSWMIRNKEPLLWKNANEAKTNECIVSLVNFHIIEMDKFRCCRKSLLNNILLWWLPCRFHQHCETSKKHLSIVYHLSKRLNFNLCSLLLVMSTRERKKEIFENSYLWQSLLRKRTGVWDERTRQRRRRWERLWKLCSPSYPR